MQTTAYRAFLLPELSEWESVRHSDSEVSSSGAPAPKLCVTLGVLPDLSVLNVVIHEMEMTMSLCFIKASMSKYL